MGTILSECSRGRRFHDIMAVKKLCFGWERSMPRCFKYQGFFQNNKDFQSAFNVLWRTWQKRLLKKKIITSLTVILIVENV